MLKILDFNTWLQSYIKHDSIPLSHRIQESIILSKKRKFSNEKEIDVIEISIRTNFLVVPNTSNSNTNIIIPSKIIRIY